MKPAKRVTLALLFCVLVVALLPGRSVMHGQQQPTISLDVKVISVLATVRDKRGKIISNLEKEDFSLDEDGRPQTIRYFSRETDLPLTLGLLVDTSGSQRGVLDEERSASYSFLNDMLREKQDVAFLIHFDFEVELLQDLTSSRKLLEQGLELLEVGEMGPQFGSPGNRGGGGRGGGRGGPPNTGFGGAGTLLYDSVFLAADEVIQTQPGRKALIVLSDGVDHGSKTSIEKAIMTAQRADAIVYSILFTDNPQNQVSVIFGGPGLPGGTGGLPQVQNVNGKKILERISNETGGRMFEVTKKQPIEAIYKTIAEELRNQYSIGYTSTQTTSAANYRKIHLTTKLKDATVQARDGYYANR